MPSYYSTKPRFRSSSKPARKSYNSRPRFNRSSGQGIHPSKFVKKATAETAEAFIPVNTFDDFKVTDLIKQNITAKNFTHPSPIQDQVIPLVLEGKDIIGIANTGTGKTAAFGIPVLSQLIETRGDRVLVMAPTRELAQQIDEDFASFAKGSGLHAALLIGGMGIGPQLRELRANPQVVIGTPGRIKDHIERGTLKMDNISKVVLDEVDRMLDMGFIADIKDILSQLPQSRQSLFFSATLDGAVNGLIQQFASSPVTVSVKSGTSSENVNQDVVSYVSKEDRMGKLHDILITGNVKTIIFDETQRSVERLNTELLNRGFKTDAIHGGKSQGQRKRALDKFKNNHVNILVATDVAARGIDVSDVTHVINYSIPQTYEDYVHRIGRTGRAGNIGQALTFVSK